MTTPSFSPPDAARTKTKSASAIGISKVSSLSPGPPPRKSASAFLKGLFRSENRGHSRHGSGGDKPVAPASPSTERPTTFTAIAEEDEANDTKSPKSPERKQKHRSISSPNMLAHRGESSQVSPSPVPTGGDHTSHTVAEEAQVVPGAAQAVPEEAQVVPGTVPVLPDEAQVVPREALVPPQIVEPESTSLPLPETQERQSVTPVLGAKKPPPPPRIISTPEMTQQILASPLVGNLPPPDSAITSPTVLRKPPLPRAHSSTVVGIDNSELPPLSPPVSPLSPWSSAEKPPLHAKVFSPLSAKRAPPRSGQLWASTGVDKTGKDLVELAEDAFTSEMCSVTKLLLGRNQLHSLPSTFSNLTELQILDMSYNKFEHLPPLEPMTKLRDMSLQGNLFLQNENGLNGLSKLVSLQKLDLSSNQIGNPAPVASIEIFYLTSLQELALPHNELPYFPADVAWLANLTCLDLSYNRLAEIPAEIGSLYFLKKLLLRSNCLTFLPEEVSALANLTEFDVAHNQIGHLSPAFGSLAALTNLDLSHNQIGYLPVDWFGAGEPIVSEDGSSWVVGLFALKKLRLRGNLLTHIPDSLFNLPELQLLDLTCNQLEQFPFVALPNIDQLLLGGNKLTIVPEEIVSNMASLSVLNVSDNLIASLPSTLWQLASLRQLLVAYNQLTALPLPPPDACWESIEEIFAAGNPSLTDISPFGTMSSLTHIYLQSCGFTTTPLLHSLPSLPSLEQLDLSHNHLSTLDPSITALEGLGRLAISHNDVIGLPDQLVDLRRLEYFDLSYNRLTLEPECVKYLATSVGTEVVVTGNPYCVPADYTSSLLLDLVLCDLVGRRPTMEDTFCECTRLGGVEGRMDAYAIFDGHAGSFASRFVAKYLPRILTTTIETRPTESPLRWLEITFSKLVDLYREKLQDPAVPTGAKHCGTTGLILLVDESNYYVANVGDTRAVLCRGGKAVRISTDDKPSNADEMARIRNVGGYVVIGSDIARVNGTLAVSRSIGDFYMHPFVTAVPHLVEVKREADDQFLVLACDGVWDELEDQQSVDIVLSMSHPTDAAFAVRDKAYAYGSDDNISVMILQLKQQRQPQQEQQQQHEQQQSEQQEQPHDDDNTGNSNNTHAETAVQGQ